MFRSSQELIPKYIEQDAKQGPSGRFAERAGSGMQACPSSEELLGLRECTCAGARISMFLSSPVPRVSSILLPHAAKFNTGSR